MGPSRLRKPAENAIHGRYTLNLLYVSVEAASAVLLEFAGRCLLVLLVISISTMPLTQHLWAWDRFLRGGQDFEFGALGILLLFSLVLVVSRRSKQSVELLFSRECIAGIRWSIRSATRGVFRGALSNLYADFVPDPALSVSSIFLRI